MFLGAFAFPFVLVIAVVLLALAGKSEDDPGRERPASLYLSALTLVGVILLLVGTFLAAHGLVELTNTEPTGYSISTGRQSIEIGPDGAIVNGRRPRIIGGFESSRTVNHDDDVSQLIGGVIVAAIAIAILRFHLPKLQDLAATSTGPGARVYNRLLYMVCGVTLLSGLAAAGTTLYSIYGMIAPETAGAGRVTDAFRDALAALAVTAVATVLFREAWQKSDLAPVTVVEVESEPEVTEPLPVKKATRVRKAAPPKE